MKIKINSFKLLFLFCFSFNQVYSNVFYEYSHPSFSIEILDSWVVDRSSIMPDRYDKFNRKNDKQSVFSIKRERYLIEIKNIWNLDEYNTKKEIELGQNISEFKFKKIKINENHAIKAEFNLSLSSGGLKKNYKCSMYKILFLENNVEYVIHFYLLSDPDEFKNSDNDVLKMISSIKRKDGEKNVFKLFEFNNYKFKIPILKNYSYFSDIQRGNPLSNKFNPENINLTGVVSFEYLIADSIGIDPLIHIYSNEMFRNKKISKVDFNEAKIFWKGIYEKNNFKIVTDLIKKDSSSIFSEASNINLDLTPSVASNLIDENNLLSTLVILENGAAPNQGKQIFITNYIYIKEMVVFIKLSKSFTKYSDILKLEKLSIDIVDEFLKINN